MTLSILCAIVAGLLLVLVLARRPAMTSIQPPSPGTFSPESIAKGEALAAIGHCASCHTAPGGEPFAGGYGVQTPFGVIYGTNITPDPESGIGSWSLEAFTRAMREGVARDGSHLFPAFPYYAYTKLADQDIQALYAYLMTRRPAAAIRASNTVPFPLRIRALQEGWKILFFRGGRQQADPAKSAIWNRGAYLSEALADCAGCHTPRNVLGAETRRAYAGAVIDGWVAPALDETNPSPVPWTEAELFTYLRTGASALHGATGATMTAVIREGLALPSVAESDVRAIAAYFAEMDRAGAREGQSIEATRQALATSANGSSDDRDPDAVLYAAACISCHYNAASGPSAARPELALTSALTLPEPTNFIRVVLRGVGGQEGAPGLVMPAYSSLDDGDIARLAAYLRRTRTHLPPWNDLPRKVAAIRRDSEKTH